MRRIVGLLVLAWLVIGVVATAQRGYVSGGETSCAGISTIVVTILAGPLNHLGVNPRADCPELPQPSQWSPTAPAAPAALD